MPIISANGPALSAGRGRVATAAPRRDEPEDEPRCAVSRRAWRMRVSLRLTGERQTRAPAAATSAAPTQQQQRDRDDAGQLREPLHRSTKPVLHLRSPVPKRTTGVQPAERYPRASAAVRPNHGNRHLERQLARRFACPTSSTGCANQSTCCACRKPSCATSTSRTRSWPSSFECRSPANTTYNGVAIRAGATRWHPSSVVVSDTLSDEQRLISADLSACASSARTSPTATVGSDSRLQAALIDALAEWLARPATPVVLLGDLTRARGHGVRPEGWEARCCARQPNEAILEAGFARLNRRVPAVRAAAETFSWWDYRQMASAATPDCASTILVPQAWPRACATAASSRAAQARAPRTTRRSSPDSTSTTPGGRIFQSAAQTTRQPTRRP